MGYGERGHVRTTMTTVAESIVAALQGHGVKQVWGVVGDALNPVTDAIRRQEGIEWMSVRHEEVAAFAASAQAQLTGELGVCMGTVGPGSIHLLNGLYDAKKSHAPVLAVCGQVPLAEMGTEYFQEVDNDAVFDDVSLFNHTVTSPDQMPVSLERAVDTALTRRGVSVLTLPGDIGSMKLPRDAAPARFVDAPSRIAPDPAALSSAAEQINAAGSVTLLVGIGARDAQSEVLALAEKLSAPMVLTIKAKDSFDGNPFQVGQTGLLGNPAARHALEGSDLLLMIGTDFPYADWYPEGKTVIQIDRQGDHIGRRTSVDLGVVGDAALTVRTLIEHIDEKEDASNLESSRKRYTSWRADQLKLADPDYDHEGIVGRVRSKFDNPEKRIRPEAVAALLDQHAANDAIFTSDTGMSTVWLARFVDMRDSRRLIGSFNLGSMANAMPQALGAQALDKTRQVVAFCGDGGLTMLMGDLITAVAHELPVRIIVFNNGALGMVKLEQEQGGLPTFGTELANPDFAAVARAVGLHGIRVEDPDDLEAAVLDTLAHPGPVLLDAVTNPDEISLPPKIKVSDGWGFAIAKMTEEIESRRA